MIQELLAAVIGNRWYTNIRLYTNAAVIYKHMQIKVHMCEKALRPQA